MGTTRADRPSPAPADGLASVEPAPAKINLALHVTGKRNDGYHSIDTLVVFTRLGDMLRVEPGEAGIELDITGPFAEALERSGPTEANLALRAARLLAESRRRARAPTRLILDKRLPVSSGIGGGSADAAAALRLLDRHWALATKPARLGKLAEALGADVPMCLASQPTRAGGIGEALKPLAAMPDIPLVLVNPGVGVATKAVFGRLKEFNPPLPAVPSTFKSVFELAFWLRQTRNGLYEAALAEAKPIGRAIAALSGDADCLLARMSGSGATCFGIFASTTAAGRAALRLRVAEPDWWIAATVSRRAKTGASDEPRRCVLLECPAGAP